jgi:hypothetical protein
MFNGVCITWTGRAKHIIIHSIIFMVLNNFVVMFNLFLPNHHSYCNKQQNGNIDITYAWSYMYKYIKYSVGCQIDNLLDKLCDVACIYRVIHALICFCHLMIWSTRVGIVLQQRSSVDGPGFTKLRVNFGLLASPI